MYSFLKKLHLRFEVHYLKRTFNTIHFYKHSADFRTTFMNPALFKSSHRSLFTFTIRKRAAQTFFLTSPFVFSGKKRKSYRFETACEWIIDDRNATFGCFPVSSSRVKMRSYRDRWCVCWEQAGSPCSWWREWWKRSRRTACYDSHASLAANRVT